MWGSGRAERLFSLVLMCNIIGALKLRIGFEPHYTFIIIIRTPPKKKNSIGND